MGAALTPEADCRGAQARGDGRTYCLPRVPVLNPLPREGLGVAAAWRDRRPDPEGGIACG